MQISRQNRNNRHACSFIQAFVRGNYLLFVRLLVHVQGMPLLHWMPSAVPYASKKLSCTLCLPPCGTREKTVTKQCIEVGFARSPVRDYLSVPKAAEAGTDRADSGSRRSCRCHRAAYPVKTCQEGSHSCDLRRAEPCLIQHGIWKLHADIEMRTLGGAANLLPAVVWSPI